MAIDPRPARQVAGRGHAGRGEICRDGACHGPAARGAAGHATPIAPTGTGLRDNRRRAPWRATGCSSQASCPRRTFASYTSRRRPACRSRPPDVDETRHVRAVLARTHAPGAASEGATGKRGGRCAQYLCHPSRRCGSHRTTGSNRALAQCDEPARHRRWSTAPFTATADFGRMPSRRAHARCTRRAHRPPADKRERQPVMSYTAMAAGRT